MGIGVLEPIDMFDGCDICVADNDEKDESDKQFNWMRMKEMTEPDDSDPQ